MAETTLTESLVRYREFDVLRFLGCHVRVMDRTGTTHDGILREIWQDAFVIVRTDGRPVVLSRSHGNIVSVTYLDGITR